MKPEGTAERCHACGRETVTALLPLSSGHIGRVCSQCRTCRCLRPYASKREYEQHQSAETRKGIGHNHERMRT
jgi:hypothetical protein